ncbi:hypothetical protein [Pseudodesulfovibrio sp. S3]|uniref:hypothetical protein n=2 Tax=unclassified Pseudodesulfovibrio TaxID=2661612 RepID=UPI0013E3C5B0|nr:hypothetical protein [Pseudodesulfovibrio sp. S3]
MDNDTRLAMMNMSNNAHRQTPARSRRNNRSRRSASATMVSTMAAFALTLFTRGA